MSYRDDLEAAKLRRQALTCELHEVQQRMDELNHLGQRARELERELAHSAAERDQARARVSLPLLSRVDVASPCHESWDHMSGDERVRHCGRCDKNVYDLSALTAEQAETLLREHGASMCVRFYRRADGTVLTQDCPVGAKKRRFRRLAIGVAGGVLLGAGAAAALTPSMVVMGNMARRPAHKRVDAMQRAPEPEACVQPEEVEEIKGDVAIEPEPEPELEEIQGKPTMEKPEQPVRKTMGRVVIDRLDEGDDTDSTAPRAR